MQGWDGGGLVNLGVVLIHFFALGFHFLFSLGLGAGVWDGCSHMSRVTISRRGKEQIPNMIRSLGLAGLGGGGFGAGKVQHKVPDISLNQFCKIIPTSGGGADLLFLDWGSTFILFGFES